MFCFREFLPFVSLQKLVMVRFFKISLSRVCAKAEVGMADVFSHAA